MSKACNQRIFAKDVKMPIDSGVGHKGRVEAEKMSSDQNNGRQGLQKIWSPISETRPLALPPFSHLHRRRPGQLTTGPKAGSTSTCVVSLQTRDQPCLNSVTTCSQTQSDYRNLNLQPQQNVHSAKGWMDLSTFSPVPRPKTSDPSCRSP